MKRDWSTLEVKILTEEGHLGVDHVCERTGRSRSSVKCKASELGQSLRRPGCKKGLRLGQPRRSQLSDLVKDPELREALADPAIAAELTAALAADVVGDGELCPRCSSRRITRKSTGLCDVCHFRGLAQKWRDKQAVKAAKAEYYREREQGKRRVECIWCGQEYSPRLDREGRKSDRNVCPDCRALEGPPA